MKGRLIFMNIKTYESLSAFFAQDNFSEIEGDYVQTLGFDAAGDGGAAVFKVISVSSETTGNTLEIDGRTFVCKGLTLELIPENNSVYVEQFGAKGNVELSDREYTADEILAHYLNIASLNKNAIEQAVKAAPVVAFRTKDYFVSENIIIDTPVKLLGNNARLLLNTENETASMFIVDCNNNDGFSKTEFWDMFIAPTMYGDYLYTERTAISVNQTHNLVLNNIHFMCAGYALNTTSAGIDLCENISVIDCIAEDVCNGLYFKDATNVKIRNLRIDHANTEIYPDAVSGFGLKLEGNCFGANVEDLSVFNSSGGAVSIANGVWDSDATNSIFIKNLLIDGVSGNAISIQTNNIPVRFANAMVINARIGMLLNNSENVDVVNSSIVVNDSTGWMLNLVTYVKAKFTKTQFEFPDKFQKFYLGVKSNKTAELSFVDCTLQKSDMGDNAIGFGTIGYTGNYNNAAVQTFDACEFRSYQKNFATFNSNGTITDYKPGITLATKTIVNEESSEVEKSSKVIIKNCRFVNDAPCNAPYFMLNDAKTYDNIVVYNCFFENYTYSETADGVETFPLFAKVTNGIAVADTTNHNVFARCNMRSSTPIRGEGTTINETKEYQ